MTDRYFNAPLAEVDPEIAQVLDRELKRQQTFLEMIASENFVPVSVLQAQGSVLTNKYAEGYPAYLLVSTEPCDCSTETGTKFSDAIISRKVC